MSNLLFSKREGPLKKIRMVLFDWYSQMRKTLLLAIFIFLLSFCTITKINNPGLIIELGQGWAGNTVNTVIFRHHGIVTFSNYQFTAYYKDKENLIVVRRDLRTDDIVTASLVGNYNVYDAHNSISLGIDNNGYIHISYDHHGHELRYQVSENPLDISEWSDPLPMTGIRETKVTYPSFLMNPIDSSLLFLYRYGGPNKGQACMKLFDPVARVWDDHIFFSTFKLQIN